MISVFKDSLLGLILHKKTYNMWWTDADCAAFILIYVCKHCYITLFHIVCVFYKLCIDLTKGRNKKIGDKMYICIISKYYCYGYGFVGGCTRTC